jgi:hypothetical protein
VCVLVPATHAIALSVTPDPTWSVNGKVYALAQDGSTLYVGGTFKRAYEPGTREKVPSGNLVAFDESIGEAISTFSVDVEDDKKMPQVQALAVSPDGSTLYLGGIFNSVDGSDRTNFAAVDASTGALLPQDPEIDGPVHCMLLIGDDLYIGGEFKHVDGSHRPSVAELALDGTLMSGWKPTVRGTVRDLTLAPGGTTMFLGGNFSEVDKEPRQSVALVDTTTGALDPWTIPAGVIESPQTAWDVIPTATRIYVAFGQELNYVAAFRTKAKGSNPAGSQVWRYSTVGNVESMALASDDRLFVGGHFGLAADQEQPPGCGGTYVRGLMSSTTPEKDFTADCSWLPQLAPYGSNHKGAWVMLLSGDELWVGGYFTTIGGVAQSGIARFTL